ncbi:MAG: trigger factor family protein [Methylacidiphilales bacterium]|nr:trigger factor family protein [Candidatus Methylacidiphilales bacterium]
MSYEVKEISQLEREVVFSVSWEEFDKSMQKQLVHLKQTVAIDGFRKGKVPDEILLKKYTETLQDQAIKDISLRCWSDYLASNKNIVLATQPMYNPKLDIKNKILSIDYFYELSPEINLLSLESLEITKFEYSINQSDFTSMKEKVIKEHGNDQSQIAFEKLGFIGDDAEQKFDLAIKQTLLQEVEFKLFQKNKESILEALLNEFQFSLPPSILAKAITTEERRLGHELHEKAGHTHKAEEPCDKHVELDSFTKTLIEKRLKSDWILKHIVNNFNIIPKQEVIKKLISQTAQSTQDPEKAIRQLVQNDYWRNYFFTIALEIEFVDHIFNRVKIVSKPVKLSDLIDTNNK